MEEYTPYASKRVAWGIKLEKMKKLLIILSVCAVSAGQVLAQTTLTLGQAVEIAMKNSPAIKTAEQKLKDAKGQEISAFSNFVPGITLNGSWGLTSRLLPWGSS